MGRENRGWVYISEAAARLHPLYGLDGWLWLIAAKLLLGPPLILLFHDVVLANEFAPYKTDFAHILLVTGPHVLYSWFVFFLMIWRRERFRTHFTLLSLLEIGGSAVGVALIGLHDLAFRHFVLTPIFLAYIYLSKRINVTFLLRVRSTDPFLAVMRPSPS